MTSGFVASSRNARKLQLGLQGATYFQDNFPFLNWWYTANYPTVFRSAGGGGGQVTGGACWTATGGANYFDPVTCEVTNPASTDIASFSRLFYTPSQMKSIINTIGWPWGAAGCLTADWQGSATGSITSLGTGGATDSGNGSTGPITFHIGSGSDAAPILRLFPTNVNDPPRNIRIYPTRYAANINRGEIFNPDWLAQVRQFGRLRMMNWNVTNYGNLINLSDIATQASQMWGFGLAAGGVSASTQPVGGMPLGVICALAAQTGCDIHYCIPLQATDACVTSIAQYFRDNCPTKVWIEYNNEDWNPGNVNGTNGKGSFSYVLYKGCASPDGTLGIAVTNITAGNPTTLTVGNSAGFGAFTSISTDDAAFGPLLNNQNQFTATIVNSTTITIPINTTGAGSYTGTTTFISNTGARGPRYSGYRSAQIMNIFRTTFNNRARWGGILATQTATSASVTTNKISGANVYCAANGLILTDLFDEVDATSYVGQVNDFFKENNGLGVNITTVTKANPGVVTLTGHGYSNGQVKKFFVTSGMTQLQNTFATITVIDANSFSIGIDTTSYTTWISANGNFICDGTVFQLMDTSLTNFTNDPVTYTTQYSYFNGIVKAALLNGSSNGLVCTQSLADKTAASTGTWTIQKVVSDANSLALGQYEGGPSWSAGARLASTQGSISPQATDYFFNWNWSQECADVMAATWAQWIGSGPSAIFTECGSLQPLNPWPGMRTIPSDINNPRWAAGLRANRGP